MIIVAGRHNTIPDAYALAFFRDDRDAEAAARYVEYKRLGCREVSILVTPTLDALLDSDPEWHQRIVDTVTEYGLHV